MAASDILKNVVDYLSARHDGHFHSRIGCSCKFNRSLKFLEGTQRSGHS